GAAAFARLGAAVALRQYLPDRRSDRIVHRLPAQHRRDPRLDHHATGGATPRAAADRGAARRGARRQAGTPGLTEPPRVFPSLRKAPLRRSSRDWAESAQYAAAAAPLNFTALNFTV